MMLRRLYYSSNTTLFPGSHLLNKLKIIAMVWENIWIHEDTLRMCSKREIWNNLFST